MPSWSSSGSPHPRYRASIATINATPVITLIGLTLMVSTAHAISLTLYCGSAMLPRAAALILLRLRVALKSEASGEALRGPEVRRPDWTLSLCKFPAYRSTMVESLLTSTCTGSCSSPPFAQAFTPSSSTCTPNVVITPRTTPQVAPPAALPPSLKSPSMKNPASLYRNLPCSKTLLMDSNNNNLPSTKPTAMSTTNPSNRSRLNRAQSCLRKLIPRST